MCASVADHYHLLSAKISITPLLKTVFFLLFVNVLPINYLRRKRIGNLYFRWTFINTHTTAPFCLQLIFNVQQENKKENQSLSDCHCVVLLENICIFFIY